jgi:hypothetical protein
MSVSLPMGMRSGQSQAMALGSSRFSPRKNSYSPFSSRKVVGFQLGDPEVASLVEVDAGDPEIFRRRRFGDPRIGF